MMTAMTAVEELAAVAVEAAPEAAAPEAGAAGPAAPQAAPQAAPREPPLPLTPRQSEVLAFIVRCIRQHMVPPTIREIGLHFRIASPNGVCCHLKALADKGWIAWASTSARGIKVHGLAAWYADNEAGRRLQGLLEGQGQGEAGNTSAGHEAGGPS